MSRMKILSAATLTLAFLVSAFAADITGKWTSSFESQIGPQKYTFDLKVTGDTITGQATSDQRGAVEIKEGKISGENVSFVELANIQGQDIRIEYNGKVSGDEMKLTRKVGDFATYEIVAKRAK
jgi:hypothetical protein